MTTCFLSPSRPLALLDPDILVPQLRPRRDELAHQPHTLGVVDDLEHHASRAHVVLGTAEGAVLADHDAGDSIEQRGAAAHVAWRERGVEHGPPILRAVEAADDLEAVHLGGEDRAASLDPAVVAAADDLPAEHENRTD